MATPEQIRRRGRWTLLGATVVIAVVVCAVFGSGAFGSSVSSAVFSGGAGTTTVNGTLYAKTGGALTLTVSTSNDTKCVEVTGAFTARQTSSTAKSTWTFSFTAGAGDGAQSVTAAASPNFNASNCTGQSQSPKTASFTLDNTGPVVTAGLAPSPNAGGWSNANVAITWSATDGGSRRSERHARERQHHCEHGGDYQDVDRDRPAWQHRYRLRHRQARQGKSDNCRHR